MLFTHMFFLINYSLINVYDSQDLTLCLYIHITIDIYCWYLSWWTGSYAYVISVELYLLLIRCNCYILMILKKTLQINISNVWFLINNVADDRTKKNLQGFFLYYKKVNDFFHGLFRVLSTVTRRQHFFRSSFVTNEYLRCLSCFS
jgi:hypothetical protein